MYFSRMKLNPNFRVKMVRGGFLPAGKKGRETALAGCCARSRPSGGWSASSLLLATAQRCGPSHTKDSRNVPSRLRPLFLLGPNKKRGIIDHIALL